MSLEVDDEAKEGFWGYLLPKDGAHIDETLDEYRDEAHTEAEAQSSVGRHGEIQPGSTNPALGFISSAYIIGRNSECDCRLEHPTISNRHCLIFSANKYGQRVAVIEDLSGNGTVVNQRVIGRNNRRELHTADEISFPDETSFIFFYAHDRCGDRFRQQYRVIRRLGKGSMGIVHRCVESNTEKWYAVKRFKRPHGGLRNLDTEIGVMKSISHPNIIRLEDVFYEEDSVFLVLELAPEEELFQCIVANRKLTEGETQKVFIQLFQGIKYLHERNIVYRDIKPENILLADKELSVKLADFRLARFIGEELFTACGTPSYVAPEVIADLDCRNFAYPSPHWDTISELVLDVIDRMLTVDVNDRITIDECLQHPWTLHSDCNDSHQAQVMDQVTDSSREESLRERTLLNLHAVELDKASNGNEYESLTEDDRQNLYGCKLDTAGTDDDVLDGEAVLSMTDQKRCRPETNWKGP